MPEEINNPFERIKVSELKDHEFREMVNEMTKVACLFANTQQLRERVSGVLLKHLRPFRDESIRPTDDEGSAAITANYLEADDPILQGIHLERRVSRLTEEDVNQIAYTSDEVSSNRMLKLMEDSQKPQLGANFLLMFSEYRKKERLEAIRSALSLLRR